MRASTFITIINLLRQELEYATDDLDAAREKLEGLREIGPADQEEKTSKDIAYYERRARELIRKQHEYNDALKDLEEGAQVIIPEVKG